MNRAQKKLLSFLLAASLAVMATVTGAMTPAMTAQAAPPRGEAGKPHDGVDFTALTGDGFYYGTYDHAVGLEYGDNGRADVEGIFRPILWRVTGEDSDCARLTLFSEYILDSGVFHDMPVNKWSESVLCDWLNSALLYGFSEAEIADSLMPVMDVSTGFGTDAANTALNQKMYLPWGIMELLSGQNEIMLCTDDSASSLRCLEEERRGMLKNGQPVYYWLRSPMDQQPAFALCVDPDGEVLAETVDAADLGIRPVFRIDPASILFLSETGQSAAQGGTPGDADYAPGTGGKKYYKLTIVNESLVLAGLSMDGASLTGNGQTLSVASGGGLVLASEAGTTPDTGLAYKIVQDDGGVRTTVGCGSADSLPLTVSATANMTGGGALSVDGDYTLYVWAQKSNAFNSHEGSAPMWFRLAVDSAPPTVKSVTPRGEGISPDTDSLSIAFNEDMDTGTAGSVSISGGASVRDGVWQPDGRTIVYRLSGLTWSTAFTVSISGFRDAVGNLMTPVTDDTWQFTTEDQPPPGRHPITVAASPPEAGSPEAGQSAAALSTRITLHANANPGWRFDGWRSPSLGVSFNDAQAETTAFEMPDNAVDIIADYSSDGGGLDDPAQADPGQNTLTLPQGRVFAGDSFSVTASGHRQSARGVVTGDQQYLPVSCEISGGAYAHFTLQSGVFRADGLRADQAGECEITALFSLRQWDGAAWRDTGEVDAKVGTLTIHSAGRSLASPASGDEGRAGGDSGSGDRVDPAPHIIFPDEMRRLIAQAEKHGQDYVRSSRGASVLVKADAWKLLRDKTFVARTAENGRVLVQLTFPRPWELASDMKVGGQVGGSVVSGRKTFFQRWYANRLQIVHLEHTGEFGQPVRVAAWVDLTGMNTESLVFYNYNKAANSYRQIRNPDHRMDKNGYLHFTTEYGGDIVISDGALAH